QIFKPQAEHQTFAVDGACRRAVKELRGAVGMLPDACRAPLAQLDARRGQLDKSLQKIGRRPAAPRCMPQRFPGFVGFPIEAMVEQINCVEISGVVVIRRFCERRSLWLANAVAMSARIARRMRREARYIAIRRQWTLRTVSPC